MKAVLRILFWSVVVVTLLVGLDVVLHRATFEHSALKAGQRFYVDFRQRLVSIWQPRTIEAVIEQKADPAPSMSSESRAEGTRYLYKDADGILQFADTLDDVPPPFRQEAQPLGP